MTTAKLIEHFAQETHLPVDVNAVLQKIRQLGHDEDDIEFVGVDINADIMLGEIKMFYVRPGPYADPIRHANIYYCQSLDLSWQRMICCKELTHLMDPPHTRTTNVADIEKLAEKIGLPPEMQDPVTDGPETNRDRLAEWRAAAILLPLAARGALLDAYKSGKVSVADIARLADIPSKYAAFVMSDSWPKIHDLLLKAG
ncbi:hypothetical protein NUH86_10830 [Sphingobium sp. JS3065]|uniref:hypothetical protein n=1 Tax=Sphingobium sp. JS3065 TaxID=2970925 RepID=UPI0022656660|nr:hypothetical protein [Sphingobium sp. JS3065]UZW54029.1 hypothetical protein NUH86_10830 [Sphingobium sp. JS3065]